MDRTTWLSQILSKSVFEFIYTVFVLISLCNSVYSLCNSVSVLIFFVTQRATEKSQRATESYLIFDSASIKASTEAVIISVFAEKP